MKICTKCHKEKELSEFYKEKTGKFGVRADCKTCWNNQVKEIYNINKKQISVKRKRFRKERPWQFILYDIKKRCENKNHDRYKDYGGRGIKNSLTKEDIKFLWFREEAYLLNQPSIDRKDNNGNYTLSNCQFIELDINRIKDRSKSILQFDLEGNFIKEWNSIK